MSIIIPDNCTSFNSCKPCEHCKDCSHALYYGELKLNDKLHKFEFSPQYGIWFLTKSGEHRKIQPAENNPVWDEFEKWHTNKFGGK